MAFDPHSEIFQDFLLEAGELLESLNEQLVELESNPEDSEALNAVFRGFHTIKGGAGFLELTSIVELCHRSEDLFGLIREDKLKLTEAVMDPVLAAVDELNVMFEALQEGVEPEAAPVTIIQQLEAILNPSSVAEPEPKPEIQVIAETRGEAEADENEDISEDEFEALLDRLDGDEDEVGGASGTEFVTDVLLKGDPEKEFTEDEFDLLLDTLDEETVEVEAVAAVTQVIPESKAAEVLPSEPQSAPPTPPAAVEKAEVKKPKQKPSGKTPQHGKSESSVRVDTRRLDDVMNMVGELVLIRNRFENLKQSISSEIVDRTISDLNLLTTDIQEVVMRLRMQPVRKVFSRFPRVVRDLARKLNRKVKLELVGEETEVDKNLVEELADPLIHLIRNAVDHGVEPLNVRMAAGKPAEGTVVLSAEQEGDHILLTIKDDGAGMNPETLRHLAVKRGMMDQETVEKLPDRALYNLIFEPGFSTKKEISDVSGRGVGMDVVKTHINQLNGQIDIDSELGGGTTIAIQVPLTLAIMPTLMVRVGSQVYAIPLPGIIELFEWSFVEVGRVGGREVVRLRDRTYPLIHASELLEEPQTHSAEQRVLIIELAGHALALVVDQVIGQEEVVIKPLGTLLRGMPGYSGATITGDGGVAMILDIASMVSKRAGGDFLAFSEFSGLNGEEIAA
ncbi:MAG: chemotaxis protein CheA [Gammaproteobacteria bacterium]|jgi:two-component system, chemotaxis family, sensor kinase CheA|nr:chemotaxis protein CheA [Gammaproteobacteria bacterium]